MPLKFFHPRFWPTWLGIGLLRTITLLPWAWQMAFGRGIGKILYLALPSRRKISCINLEIAFPKLSPAEREKLNREHFLSLGEGLLSTSLSWWASSSTLNRITRIEGIEHIINANEEGGVILVGGHFSSIELSGRILANHIKTQSVYRPHQNSLLEYLTIQKRNQHYGKTISKNNIRDMVRSLKNKQIVWYATDQNYRGKNSILVPFFNVDAPTNSGTSRLSKITNAKVIPIFPIKLSGENEGYLLRILPPLTAFPSDSPFQDTLRLNQIIEEQVKEFPAQYLWTHKRYKHYDSENKDFYKNYALNNESNCT